MNKIERKSNRIAVCLILICFATIYFIIKKINIHEVKLKQHEKELSEKRLTR